MIERHRITGLVLAGGRGSRMGGVDKGLESFDGQPLALRAAWRLTPQVGTVIVNANRNLGAYEGFGYPVVPDPIGGFQGPLAGFLAGLEACETEFLITVPCDSPFFPLDLVARLAERLEATGSEAATACVEGRAQPVFTMMQSSALESLHRFLGGGKRRIDAWTDGLKRVDVEFDDIGAFVNVNDAEALRAAQADRRRD